jgi:hypothetical protein
VQGRPLSGPVVDVGAHLDELGIVEVTDFADARLPP